MEKINEAGAARSTWRRGEVVYRAWIYHDGTIRIGSAQVKGCGPQEVSLSRDIDMRSRYRADRVFASETAALASLVETVTVEAEAARLRYESALRNLEMVKDALTKLAEDRPSSLGAAPGDSK